MLVNPGLIFYSVHNGYKYFYIDLMLKLNSAFSARMYCLFYNISANIRIIGINIVFGLWVQISSYGNSS